MLKIIMQKKTLLELTGSVEKIIFTNGKNGYSVVEVLAEDELVTAVGTMPEINVGESVKLMGGWKNHPSFGEQFCAQVCERSMPTTSVSILKYLSSGAIKGVGPSIAGRIVEKFGDKTLDIMEKAPEKLAQIKGITAQKSKKISEEFTQMSEIKELMNFLGKYGISPEDSVRVFKVFGKNAIENIKNSPYDLCCDTVKIPFSNADRIAADLNIETDNECRIRAGIEFVLEHNANNGHTCLPKNRLEETVSDFLEVEVEKIQNSLQKLVKEGSLQLCNFNARDFIFLNRMYKSESYIAGRIAMMMKFLPEPIVGSEDKIDLIEQKQGITYAALQKEAIEQAVKKGILILTGGPGTGKTTTLNAIINILECKGRTVFLAAPTGRAAQRMAELTKKEAKTIHRMLEVTWDMHDNPVFKRNEKNLLKCDALVLDELSMIDVNLFESVLRALPLGCRLIMVGDCNQLNSVGAGNILDDLIKSGVVPVVQLQEVFRQASSSLIVTNAHKIVNGEMPDLADKENDFFFLSVPDPHDISQTIQNLCKNRLPKAYGYSPFFDIQVISPGRKGELGTNSLNKILQEVVNPAHRQKKEITVINTKFRVGDKVMQVKNNYDIQFIKDDTSTGEGIFNGDIGIISDIDKENSSVSVRFDDKVAFYDMETIVDLELAYAITVHKSQGSEFSAVVMPMYYGAPQLYYRNLLYTGVTRAKKLLILVGTKYTVVKMVENDKKTKRYSGLCGFLS